MRIVIAGCGRVGSDLALTLAAGGHDVSVVDVRPDAFQSLGSTFNGTTYEGVAYDVDVLREAGLAFADTFVAVTSSDNANMMAVQVAQQVFGVTRAIARLDNPAREEAYRALNIHYITGPRLTSRVIHEQIIDEEFRYHVTFGEGDVEVVEMVVGPGGRGLAVSDFEIPDGVRVAAVRRNGTTHVADAGFVLEDGDLVVAAVREGVRSELKGLILERGVR